VLYQIQRSISETIHEFEPSISETIHEFEPSGGRHPPFYYKILRKMLIKKIPASFDFAHCGASFSLFS